MHGAPVPPAVEAAVPAVPVEPLEQNDAPEPLRFLEPEPIDMIPVDEQIESPEPIQHELVNEEVFEIENHGYVVPEPETARPEAIEIPAEIKARIDAIRDPQNPSTSTPKQGPSTARKSVSFNKKLKVATPKPCTEPVEYHFSPQMRKVLANAAIF